MAENALVSSWRGRGRYDWAAAKGAQLVAHRGFDEHVRRAVLAGTSEQGPDFAQRRPPHAPVEKMAEAVRVVRRSRHRDSELLERRSRPRKIADDEVIAGDTAGDNTARRDSDTTGLQLVSDEREIRRERATEILNKGANGKGGRAGGRVVHRVKSGLVPWRRVGLVDGKSEARRRGGGRSS